MKKRSPEPKMYQYIWLKIRLWAQLNNVPDEILASFVEISPRTFRDYDKSAFNLPLGKLDNFLTAAGLTLEQLMSL